MASSMAYDGVMFLIVLRFRHGNSFARRTAGLLLEHGADATAHDDNEFTLLQLTSTCRPLEVAQLLL